MKRTRIQARSKSRAKLMRTVRVPTIVEMIEAGRRCEVGPILMDAGLMPFCTGRIEGLHERRKRSSAGSLVNPENLIPSCNRCNGFVEEAPAAVRDLTGTRLIVREGDPEWPELGSRGDRL